MNTCNCDSPINTPGSWHRLNCDAYVMNPQPSQKGCKQCDCAKVGFIIDGCQCECHKEAPKSQTWGNGVDWSKGTSTEALKGCICGHWDSRHRPECEICPCTSFVSEAPAGDWELETLSSKLHDIYQEEAHRQEAAGIGPARHYDEYEMLSEPVKEFDRVLARYILERDASSRDAALVEAMEVTKEIKDRFRTLAACDAIIAALSALRAKHEL